MKKETEISIIPRPAAIKENDSSYNLTDGTHIYYTNTELKKTAKFLQEIFSVSTGYKLNLRKEKGCGISLILDKTLTTTVGKEGYKLVVSEEGIEISASTTKGVIWGCQTLRQLLPVEIFASKKVTKENWTIPALEIVDYPRFPWRGMMLDSSRTFQSVEFIKKYIDLLSLHKINIFHWHLTDDQGWRIEIKAYPELTNMGSVRGGDNPIQQPEWSSKWIPEGEVSKGYYTQDEICEIVKFAKVRGIDILPEIDLPGHSRSPAVAYPEILCKSKSDSLSVQGEKGNVWCASRKENYAMMEQILKEVADLFPFEYIHIGGDEVNRDSWKQCSECNKLAKKLGLKNGGELQAHVTQKLENMCTKLNKKLVGWNEILEKEISTDTCIMSWIGVQPGYKAASIGHPVVMAPGPFAYFDMAQRTGERGHFWAGIVNTEKVYSFDPLLNPELTEAQLSNILGVHACLWTEFCTERPDILKNMNIDENSALTTGTIDIPAPAGFTEHQTYPRLCALSEVGWTPQEKRKLEDFQNRLGGHLQRLDQLNVHYRIPTSQAIVKENIVTVQIPFSGAEVRYTTDGTNPDNNSPLYRAPFECSDIDKLKFVTIAPNGRISLIIEGASPAPVGVWTREQISTELNTIKFDISNSLNRAGNWWIELLYTAGSSALEISKVSLHENGIVITADTHTAIIGPENPNNNGKSSYKIPVKNFKKDANYAIEVEAKGILKTDNSGILNLSRSDYFEPEVIFKTKIPERPGFSPELAADWNRKTFYLTNRSAKKGETFTWIFDKPLPPAEIELKTGNPGTVNNILLDGKLQISEDGKKFTDCSTFTYGTAKTTTKKPIKAIQIIVTNDQTAKHITIQDPFIVVIRNS